jgi:hypothetical protein
MADFGDFGAGRNVLEQETDGDGSPEMFWGKKRTATTSRKCFETRNGWRRLPGNVLGQETDGDGFPEMF